MELIVACTENFVIGANGGMPWHLPADLKHFKEMTTGNTIVMGRHTWESIGHALPNRTNVVVTRQNEYVATGAAVIHSISELESIDTVGTVFIIGGGELYKNTIELANKIHITRIHASIDGDTFFTPIDESAWNCISSFVQLGDDANQYDMTFETWSRLQ
jgi:dihydrofolate reductase